MKKIMYGLLVVALLVPFAWAASDTPDGFTHFTGVAITEGVRLPTVAKDSTYQVLSTDSMTIFTNQGSTGMMTFTLPESSTVKGRPFIFVLHDPDRVNIDVASTDTIIYGGLNLDPGDRITADDDGEFIVLVALDDTPAFVPIAVGGTWTDGGA